MINYRDAQGQPSCRRITIKSTNRQFDGDILLRAWCHERDDWRSFKLSRIESIIDVRTGEIFEDIGVFFSENLEGVFVAGTDHFKRLEPNVIVPQAGRDREVSPRTELRRRLKPIRPELMILTYLARADGHYRQAEKELIADHAIALVPELAADRKWLVSHVGRFEPDFETYEQAVSAINWFEAGIVERVGDRLQRLATSDGEVSPEEKAILRAFVDYASIRAKPLAIEVVVN